MRIVFLGSGEFGVPTLRRLIAQHDVALVVSQPDRPAGRGRGVSPTPIAQLAKTTGIDLFKPEHPNDPKSIERIAGAQADVFVVIAYGHKLSEPLIESLAERGGIAINLHGSLLPKYRGAAPVQWAMINDESETGVSVITLAQRMDAGAILGQAKTPIDPLETAGELHDRLANLGPALIEKTLDDFERGALAPIEQDESQASRAPKLSKRDGTLPHGFAEPAVHIRARIHGLTPWPGCTIRLEGNDLKLRRVKSEEGEYEGPPGRLLPGGLVVCQPGAVRLLEVQPPGSRIMTFDEYVRGHSIASDVQITCESA